MRQADALQTYADLLHRFGWDPTDLRTIGGWEFRFDSGNRTCKARLAAVEREGERAATIVAIEGTRLPTSIALYQRFLDLASESRIALATAKRDCDSPFLFVVSPYECHLYESRGEELLLAAASPEESAARIFSLFTPEGWSEAAFDRLPRRSPQQWGKELADWLRVWSAKLGRAAGISPEAIRSVLTQWILAWRLAIAESDHETPGLEFGEDEEDRWASIQPPRPRVFHEQWMVEALKRFPFGMFRAHANRLESFWRNEATAPALEKFLDEASRLSRSKFLAEHVIYAFTDETTEKKSWARAMVEDVNVDRWISRSDLTIYDPVTVDVANHGYGWVLSVYEEIVRYWLSENVRRREEAERRGGISMQPDLFEPHPRGLHSTGYIDDIPLFALSHSIRIETGNAEERQLASLLIGLKTIDLCKTYNLPLSAYPDIEAIFG